METHGVQMAPTRVEGARLDEFERGSQACWGQAGPRMTAFSAWMKQTQRRQVEEVQVCTLIASVRCCVCTVSLTSSSLAPLQLPHMCPVARALAMALVIRDHALDRTYHVTEVVCEGCDGKRNALLQAANCHALRHPCASSVLAAAIAGTCTMT